MKIRQWYQQYKPELLIIVLGLIISFQTFQYIEMKYEINKFIQVGPKFTAENGQQLCERIQHLEKDKKPCEYFIRIENNDLL